MLSATNFTYDLRGRLATSTQGSGIASGLYSISYNSNGHVSSITDPLQRSVSFEYDSAGRFTRQVLPDLREINYTYDANGNSRQSLLQGALKIAFPLHPWTCLI